MSAIPSSLIQELRPKILERRLRLEAAARNVSAEYVQDLLTQVDAALERIDKGGYGLCETCHDPIEEDRLRRDPLLRMCLDHLSQAEMRAHEQDLDLAMQIQTKLLPPRDVSQGAWQVHYRYQPAGVVGGDYCEIAAMGEDGQLFFTVGDVAGKGVAASLLMAHLSAIFRSLLALNLPLTEVISRANRLFCESTPATHYATLVAGRTTESGVELCNAGHCRPLLLRRDRIERLEATGLPLGLFCGSRHAIRSIEMEPGESLVVYTDGVTEAEDLEGRAFEEDRLIESLRAQAGRDAAATIDGVLQDVERFRGTGRLSDDMTLLMIRRHDRGSGSSL